MTVRVYIWEHSRADSWGHSSLWVVDGGPYVSWWPQSEGRVYTIDKSRHSILAAMMKGIIGTTNVYKVRHATSGTYLEDKSKEGRDARWTFEIDDGVLNEDAIRRWWHGYNYETASYHTIKKNCTTTVIRGLRAGGSDQYVSYGQKGGPLSKYKGWEPTDLLSYMNSMVKGAKGRVELLGEAPEILPEDLGEGICPLHGFPLMTCPNC